MKTVSVFRKVYFWGVPCVGKSVQLSNTWKTVVMNGITHLEFLTTTGEWLKEDELYVFEYEEFLNEC